MGQSTHAILTLTLYRYGRWDRNPLLHEERVARGHSIQHPIPSSSKDLAWLWRVVVNRNRLASVAAIGAILTVGPLFPVLSVTTASAAGDFNWTLMNGPPPVPGQSLEWESLSCTSPLFCMNVGPIQGTANPSAPPESNLWDGSSWTNIALPPQSGQTKLTSVSCVSDVFCMGVGGTIASSGVTTYAAQWNGTTWSDSAAITPSGTQAALYAVSCTSPTVCEAVGQYSTGTALAEQWNGVTWSTVPAQSLSSGQTYLFGISCTGPTDCWATGEGQAAQSTLAEHFDGSTWTLVATPSLTGTSAELRSVSCVTTSFCEAVGSEILPGGGSGVPIIDSWDGSAWSTDTIPSAVAALAGVSCFGVGSCVAVGGSSVLALSNGTWTTKSTPPMPTGTTGGALASVSCGTEWGCVAEASATATGGTAQAYFVEETRVRQQTHRKHPTS
jgi:hypothetical protein